METALIIIVGYVIPLVSNWNWINIAYSKDGRWSPIDPNGSDMVIVLLPIVNLVACIMSIFVSPLRGVNRIRVPKVNINRFFNIKK